jgi:succinate dehydrogenase / fumarate reductase, cytochrome b subunit
MQNQQRPVHLNLFTIRFPITAIVSILHRLSGCFLFLLIPIFWGLWALSLKDVENFSRVKMWLDKPMIKFCLLPIAFALFHHFLAGVRHLIMDLGQAESLRAARVTAYAVLLIALLLTISTGIYLW